MSTATTLPPDRPLRPVWTPQDAEDTRRALRVQQGRWAAFLTAKDLLLGRLHHVSGTIEQNLGGWHLGSAVSMVRRAAGWLFGGFGMLRRALTTTGVRPAVAWLLSTSTGQRVAGTVVHTIGKVMRPYSAACRAVRSPGLRAGHDPRPSARDGHRSAAGPASPHPNRDGSFCRDTA